MISMSYIYYFFNSVHRDIKPHNVLIKKMDNGWQVKISDFGISKVLNNDNTYKILTQGVDFQVYMAPEVLNDQKTVCAYILTFIKFSSHNLIIFRASLQMFTHSDVFSTT